MKPKQKSKMIEELEEILMLEPIYSRPGLSKKDRKQIEAIHKRYEILHWHKRHCQKRVEELLELIVKLDMSKEETIAYLVNKIGYAKLNKEDRVE